MPELTAEQLAKAETLSTEELRALALKEVNESPTPDGSSESAKPKQARNDKGQFVADADEVETEDEEADDSGEPSRTIYRKEIDNGNGIVEVFEADSLEELVEKIAEGKRNASIKIRELSQQKKVEDTRTAQQQADDEYVIAQRLQKEPKKALKEVVAEVIAEREAATQRSQDAQNRFVATHPDFKPGESNGGRMVAWLQSHGYSEITYEGLEKAYQDLKASGLLELKPEEANGSTDTDGTATERIAQPKQEVTQQPSRKKASTLSNRTRLVTPPVSTEPTEDEMYSMPMEKLRELTHKQLTSPR